ncbi:MAG: DEAD/DEAH box helicase [Candidatus Thorarchaeota archaeon]|nr:DEAD/DEAH box helicase [Candidatus Thorarchaeota archaeon]
MVDGRGKDLFDAYDAYITALKRGTLPTGERPDNAKGKSETKTESAPSKARRRTTGAGDRVQSEAQIKKIVESGGLTTDKLPDSIRTMVTRGRDYLVSYRHIDATAADYGVSIEDMKIPKRLKEKLSAKGITQLYKFQEEAYDAISGGKDVVIAAPTAQGKTEAFVLPIIRNILLTVQESFGNPGVRALLLYPTKALARDQFEKIQALCETSDLTVGLFDGDVSQSKRQKMYAAPPDILLTNPDVLHYHLGWERSQLVPMLKTVKYVVLDEIHLYTGSMGANIYYILKRLEMESGRFQKIGASATIANPKEYAEMVFDTDVELIESTSAKRGPIHFLMYYPGDRSKYSMIVDLVRALNRGEFQTLVFGNTHTEAEVLNVLIGDAGIKSMVHRAGLTKKYRDAVESKFRSGDLPVLVSTPTLELGIDIGDLDSVISMIVSITRLTQRIGRAGRKGQESVAILALREKDPISSFYRHQPEKYFTDVDSAYMEPENEVVGRYQLIAAAMSGKLKASDFPKQERILEGLVEENLLKVAKDGRVKVADFNRAQKEWRGYSIRGIGDTVEIKQKEKKLGQRSMPMAAQELHPGAMYLHGGKNYMSVDFKYRPGMGRAIVVPVNDRSAHTRPLYSTMPKIVDIHEHRLVFGMNMIYCTLEMTQTVYGYVKRDTRSGRVIQKSDLDTPLTYQYLTRGFAFKAPEPVTKINEYLGGRLKNTQGPRMAPGDLTGGAFHALEHVAIESSDMLTGGSAREIGGVSMGDSGIIFVYDGSPGGNGASKLLFTRFEEAILRTETILAKCDCKTVDGCPLCTYSYQCGNNNQPLFRLGALESVQRIQEKVETEVNTKDYLGYQPVV